MQIFQEHILESVSLRFQLVGYDFQKPHFSNGAIQGSTVVITSAAAALCTSLCQQRSKLF